MAESTVVYARTSSGSVRGVEGGVEKLLNAFRKKEGPLGNCRKLQRLEEVNYFNSLIASYVTS